MNQQIYYTDESKGGDGSETIVANDVLPQFVDFIVTNLNDTYGGPNTACHFANRDQPK